MVNNGHDDDLWWYDTDADADAGRIADTGSKSDTGRIADTNAGCLFVQQWRTQSATDI
jgi:hypothetical protein